MEYVIRFLADFEVPIYLILGIVAVIYLRRISFPSETTAQADFEYYYKFFYVEGGKDRWQARNDFARLEFAKEDGVWRIVAGL